MVGMEQAFRAKRVTGRVYWVGAIDWAVRDFHGYMTPRGSTYNAFLVMADKIALIDTVKAPFRDELLGRIASVVDPKRISYVVSNHSETDHAGCLPEVVEAIEPECVFASRKGAEALADHFGSTLEVVPVADGESLSLGDLTLTFYETQMVHWPDSMFTYLPEDKLLFSQDAFGMHLASAELWADQLPEAVLDEEAARYYANIIMPLSPVVAKLLTKVAALDLPIEVLATDHGPLWRGAASIGRIVSLYKRWTEQPYTRKAVVVYDTMWGSTALMARAIGEGLAAGGATPRLMPLSGCHRSDVAAEVLEAGALLVGSPTLNNGMFPAVADCLTYLKGLKPQNLIGAAFGSHGWSPKAPDDVAGVLAAMKVDLVAEPLRARYVPAAETLASCYALGQTVATALCDRVAQTG